MSQNKDDCQVSLFGLPKCHFEFSQSDIARMRGFKFNFDRLMNTDFIKQRMDETPIVLAGKVDKIIPESIWADFVEKFRHFILLGPTNEPHNFVVVKGIAFRHPRSGPTPDIKRKMVRMIDHQKMIVQDAFDNDGMFSFQMASGEIISAFEMWEKYIYTFGPHVNLMPDNPDLPPLIAFGLHPNDPNARAHLASCMMVKTAAFALMHYHICDILHFIDNPAEDEKQYRHRSRPYLTDSILESSPIKTRPVRNATGYCLLGDNSVGPFTSIGSVNFDVQAYGLKIDEWRYSRGVHVLADTIAEMESAEAHIRVNTDAGIAAAKRLLQSAGAIMVRGDNFVFKAALLEWPRDWENGELRLGLNAATAELVQGDLLGPAPSMYADVNPNTSAAPCSAP